MLRSLVTQAIAAQADTLATPGTQDTAAIQATAVRLDIVVTQATAVRLDIQVIRVQAVTLDTLVIVVRLDIVDTLDTAALVDIPGPPDTRGIVVTALPLGTAEFQDIVDSPVIADQESQATAVIAVIQVDPATPVVLVTAVHPATAAIVAIVDTADSRVTLGSLVIPGIAATPVHQERAAGQDLLEDILSSISLVPVRVLLPEILISNTIMRLRPALQSFMSLSLIGILQRWLRSWPR